MSFRARGPLAALHFFKYAHDRFPETRRILVERDSLRPTLYG